MSDGMCGTLKAGGAAAEFKETLRDFSALAARLNALGQIDREALALPAEAFAGLGRQEIRVRLWDRIRSVCNEDLYEEIHRLIKLTHQSYGRVKGMISGRYSTHRFITEKALGLLAVAPALSQRLLEYCTFPDEPKSDMADLIFEGHFYGRTDAGPEGNFLGNLFPRGVAVLEAIKQATHGPAERIDEHAVMNFALHCRQAGQPGPAGFSLGVAAHYLQDLTAPHHAGNYPAVPYVDHYFFEQYASLHLHGHPAFAVTAGDYEAFKAGLAATPSDPEAFAREIYGRATAFIPLIETRLHAEEMGSESFLGLLDEEVDRYQGFLDRGDNAQWTEAVEGAVPLAIYATACLFESATAAGG
jgi:hypothetical protein